MSSIRKEARRQRGEIACAECRRLKVKCDRNVPCSTCIKRGTAALCPNETIPPGDGSRFVLAAEDHLRRKMAKMEERMHSLEDALAIVQSTDSQHPHPLLANPFSLDDDDAFEFEENKYPDDSGANGLANAFGGLHMDGDHGASRFFGPSGGSESLLLKAKEIAESQPFLAKPPPLLQLEESDPSYLPEEIMIFYQSFPFTPSGIPTEPVQNLIESFLPSMARATALCETLLENLTWMFSIVSHRHLVGDLIPAVYMRSPNEPRIYGSHDLALLLIAIGLGALVDLKMRPYDPEAQHYFRLARSALGLQSILTTRSIVTVKALHLMSIYNGMSGKESNLEHSYSLLNFAVEVALAIGFHIDPSLWGFEGKEAYERRIYFWSLLQGSLWQSLITGRPPMILETFIDCRLPTAQDEEECNKGDVPLGCESLQSAILEQYRKFNAVGVWSYRFTLECLLPAAKAILATHPPTYRTILELDHTIRSFDIPVPKPGDSARAATSMQVFVQSHYSELTLLFLHRGFFAQALTDNPTNPLLSAHSQSFVAAYQAACAVLDSTREQYAEQPQILARVWRVWSYAFSAAVIIGTVAIRTVHSVLEPSAYEKLEEACTLFQSGAETNSRASRALPILMGMLEKATQARQSARVKPGHLPVEPYDELAIFGGKSGLVLPKRPPETTTIHEAALDLRLPSLSRLLGIPESDVTSNSVSSFRTGPGAQSLYFTEDEPMAAPGGLPANWERLYREIPEPSYSFQGATTYSNSDKVFGPANPPGEAMLEDRWSSFMHQYAMMGPARPTY